MPSLDADLTRAWLRVERSLSGDLSRVARNLARARAQGQNVQTWMLSADPGWLNLSAQLGTEARRFSPLAATEIARAAEREALLGRSEVRAYLKALGVEGYPPARAREFVERQAAYRYLLDQGVPAEALQGCQKAMLDAAARGLTQAEIVAAGRDGMGRGLNRAMLVSRDQQARAYREAADAEMVASGQVAMKQRIVQRQGACAACLAKDGEVIPIDSPGYDHANGRCKWRPVLRGKAPIKRSADSWLRSQPAEYQRDVLGNARYEAFRDGRIALSSVAVETWHPTFGRGLRVAPLPPVNPAS